METTPLPTGELAEQLNMLKLKQTPLNDIDKEIEGHVPDEELDDELEAVEQYRDSIARLIFRTEKHLANACPLTASSAIQAPTSHQERVQVRLPKLEIQPFHG